MTFEELDRELARWQTAAEQAVTQVHALYEHPVSRTLAGDSHHPALALTGATRARFGADGPGVGPLLQQALELRRLVDRAAERRRHVSRLFGSEQQRAEIHALLTGPSIALPAPGTVDSGANPFDDPAASVRRLSPAQLWAELRPAYERCRDAVRAVEAAWAELPAALDQAEKEFAALAESAAGLDWPADLAGVRAALPAVRAALRADPLGAAAEFAARVREPLDRGRAELDAFVRQRAETTRGLAAARERLAELTADEARTAAVRAERTAKVLAAAPSPSPAPAPPAAEPAPAAHAGDGAAALARWLEKLEEAARQGRWASVRVGWQKWTEAAAACGERLRRAREADEALLAARRELRGRLEALDAKAAALGCAEQPDLGALAAAAHAAAARRPMPLAPAAALVDSYQQALLGRSYPAVTVAGARRPAP